MKGTYARVDEGVSLDYIATWETEALARLEALALGHEKARLMLESQLESHSQQQAYSTYLVDLMQKEERAASQGMWELYKQLTARVDSALHNELDRHFRNRSQSHQRQWTVLLEKQIQDRDRFATDITNQIMQLSATLRIPAPSILAEKLASISASPEAIQRLDSRPPATLTREQIEKRVRRQSMRHWGEQERVNLKEAFALQMARVESEWTNYLAQVEEDYRSQRAALEGHLDTTGPDGRRAALSGTRRRGVGETKAGPWRNAEKQSRLVQTAPVLTPETFGKRRGSTSSNPLGVHHRRRSSNVSLGRELTAVDHAYRANLERVEHQKAMAQQWINRQSARMHTRLEHVEQDKGLLLGYLEKEEVEFETVKDWIKMFAAEAAGSGKPAPAKAF